MTRGAAPVREKSDRWEENARASVSVLQDTAFPAMCAFDADMAGNATIMCILLTSRSGLIQAPGLRNALCFQNHSRGLLRTYIILEYHG